MCAPWGRTAIRPARFYRIFATYYGIASPPISYTIDVESGDLLTFPALSFLVFVSVAYVSLFYRVGCPSDRFAGRR